MSERIGSAGCASLLIFLQPITPNLPGTSRPGLVQRQIRNTIADMLLIYGRGDSAAEAETKARIGAVQRDHGFRNIHIDVGLARWTFITFPPWKDDDGEEETPAPVLSGAGA